jgi:solute carrier family 25 S-adenosylmethionine transporter 26
LSAHIAFGMTEVKAPRDTPFTLALVSGACAGTTVDIALYPLDTLKVRMQSEKGFLAAGGFRGVYNGVLATALGAAPGAAFFFSAYEVFKPIFRKMNGGVEHPLQHSFSASVSSCLAPRGRFNLSACWRRAVP